MGFFKFCGIDHGRAAGEAFGSSRYWPITIVRRDSLIERPDDRFKEMPDLVQRHVNNIAFLISRDETRKSDLFEILSYSIREIFRNVFEHAKTEELYYCAQYWPTKNKVEVCISDGGIGIRAALSENPNFRFSSDKEAIEHALLPGVSGKTHLPRVSENWFNSGYGLYMTNRLARNGGNFLILSGRKAIVMSSKTKFNYDCSFSGTAIRVTFSANMIGNVEKRLSEFREDATKITSILKGVSKRPPSAMSLLLRRDFSSLK